MIITDLKHEKVDKLWQLGFVPKHEQYMLINKYPPCITLPAVLMTYPILNIKGNSVHDWQSDLLAKAIPAHPMVQNVPPPSAYTEKDTEGEIPTGIENVTKMERATRIPWTYSPDKEPDCWGANGNTTPYMHYCNGDHIYRPNEERRFKLRGYLIRRGNSVEDVTNYWCNSCGFTTDDNETTYLDMLAL